MDKVLKYLRFLEEKVNASPDGDVSYDKLFKALYDIPFTYERGPNAWSEINRAEDGIALRHLYFYETHDDPPLSVNGGFSTMIEMLVAMSVRIETDIMGEPGHDCPWKWFWLMLDNLDLSYMDDDHFDVEKVEENVYTFLNHDFGPNGEGSLFPLSEWKGDQRDLSIWDQTNRYMIENYL